MFSGSVQAFALDGVGERRGDVEVQRVAEFVGLATRRWPRCRWPCRACRGGRSWTCPASPADRAGVLKPRKSRLLSVISNLRLRLRLADLSAHAGLPRGIVRLVDADVVFLLHALDELFDEFVERAVRLHLLEAARASARPAGRCRAAPVRWPGADRRASARRPAGRSSHDSSGSRFAAGSRRAR